METYYDGEGRQCIMAALLSTYPHAAMAHEKNLLEDAERGVSSRAHLFWRDAVVQDARARIGLPREEGGALRDESTLSRLCEGATMAKAPQVPQPPPCTALSEGAKTRLGVQGVSFWLGSVDGRRAEMHPRPAPIPILCRARIETFERRIQASEDNIARLVRVDALCADQNAEIDSGGCIASPFATDHLPPRDHIDSMLMLADSRARRRAPVLALLLDASARRACARVAAISSFADVRQALDASLADSLSLGMFSDPECCRDALVYDVPLLFEEQCLYILHAAQAVADALRLSNACSADALSGRRLAEIDWFVASFVSLARGDGMTSRPDTRTALSVARGVFLEQCPQASQRALAERAFDSAAILVGDHKGTLLPSFYSYHLARHGPYVMDVARELSDTERAHATRDQRIAAYSPVLAAKHFASTLSTGVPGALAEQEAALLLRDDAPPLYDLEWNVDAQERSVLLQLRTSAPRGCTSATVDWDLHTSPDGGRYVVTTNHRVIAPSADILSGACAKDAAGAGYREDVLLCMPPRAVGVLRLRDGHNSLTGSVVVGFCDEEGRYVFSHQVSVLASLQLRS